MANAVPVARVPLAIPKGNQPPFHLDGEYAALPMRKQEVGFAFLRLFLRRLLEKPFRLIDDRPIALGQIQLRFKFVIDQQLRPKPRVIPHGQWDFCRNEPILAHSCRNSVRCLLDTASIQ